jgi:hypothetical protein
MVEDVAAIAVKEQQTYSVLYFFIRFYDPSLNFISFRTININVADGKGKSIKVAVYGREKWSQG